MNTFQGQKVARWYVLYAVFLFSVQGIVSILGASSLVIPDLPSPLPYEYGRAIHLTLASFWPVIGMMGMVYYFTVDQHQAELYSIRIAQWQFAIVFLTTGGLLGTLFFKIGNGREYLEGLPVFYAGISVSLGMGAYNLIRTLWKDKNKLTPATGIMTVGVVFLCLLLLPNALNIVNPVADESIRFWVVHLWEEMAFELTTSGFIASFFVISGIAKKKDIERWLYLEASLAVSGGLFGTGHHYYWIGFPSIWLFIGMTFSVLQTVPIALLAYMTYKGFKQHRPLNRREKLTVWLILSSLFHHLTGSSAMGLLMSIPWVNLYTHGTYITSGHAHLALFGTMGFLILAGAYYILTEGSEPSQKTYRYAVLSVIMLNIGLVGMSTALIIAGFLQTYLWHFLGVEFRIVNQIINPYLILRVLSGLLFTGGDFLFAWQIIKTWKEKRQGKSPSA